MKTEKQARMEFAAYFLDLKESMKRDGTTVEKHAAWDRFVAHKVEEGSFPAEAMAWKCPRSLNKNPYDTTSTKRAKSLIDRIKETGGAVVTLRADGELIRQIDALKADGYGEKRTDVLANLVREKFEKYRPKTS